jgi:3-oxoacyl-[acyl-carrier protein] reductase
VTATAPTTGVAVITGGAGSLGHVIVGHFLKRGWQVVAIDRQWTLAETKDNSRFRSLTADLADHHNVGKVIAEAGNAFGSIDLLVNAVGAIHSEPALHFERGRLSPHRYDGWIRTIEANLTVPFFSAAAAAALMIRQPRRGAIVNITSVSARGNEGQAAYAAAKAGLEAATRVMARELGPLGVRINSVAPGFIDTSSTHAALTREILDRIVASTPLRRLGTSEEVAEAVEFCWHNTFLNGAVIAIDGGIVL